MRDNPEGSELNPAVDDRRRAARRILPFEEKKISYISVYRHFIVAVQPPPLPRKVGRNGGTNFPRGPTVSSSPPIAASLDKAVYDNFLCLVSSNKQQIHWEEVKKNQP